MKFSKHKTKFISKFVAYKFQDLAYSKVICYVFPKTSSSCKGTCAPSMLIPISAFLSSSFFTTWVGCSWFTTYNRIIKNSTFSSLPLKIKLCNMQHQTTTSSKKKIFKLVFYKSSLNIFLRITKEFSTNKITTNCKKFLAQFNVPLFVYVAPSATIVKDNPCPLKCKVWDIFVQVQQQKNFVQWLYGTRKTFSKLEHHWSTWNPNIHILKPLSMVHNNLHLNVVTLWFERIEINYKNMDLWLLHMNLCCIYGAMDWRHATKVLEPIHDSNQIIALWPFHLVFQNKGHYTHEFMQDKVDNQLPNSKQFKTMQVFICMCKFVQTTGYKNIHEDNNLKFCVFLFHERFQFLCQVMEKVFANMEVFDPPKVVILCH